MEEIQGQQTEYRQTDYFTEQLMNFLSKVYEDPDARKEFYKLQEKIGMSVIPPDPKEIMEEEVKPLRKELEKVKKELEEKKKQEQVNRVKETLERYGLDESHLTNIKNFMIANRIGDFESAVRLYVLYLASSQPNIPNSYNPTREVDAMERYKKYGKQALYEDVLKIAGRLMGGR